ncbi:MAG: diguanylate cyclase [Gemmataceae bacterium]|nr:diguanylate cyclase [Gemmataceae bacterium]
MTRIWYVARLSFALAALSLSLLFLAYGLGLIPDPEELALDSRAGMAKALGVEAAAAVEADQPRLFENVARQVINSGSDLLSAGLRNAAGDLVAEAGDHVGQWKHPGDKSTPTNVWLWVDVNGAPWGQAEFRFRQLAKPALFGLWPGGPVGRLFTFIGVTSLGMFAFYVWYVLGRVLSEADTVVPHRVRSALDTLAEGVIVLDKDRRIAHANAAFAKLAQTDITHLQGKSIDALGWARPRGVAGTDPGLPWDAAAGDGITRVGVPLVLGAGEMVETLVSVNATPILADDGSHRGVLATFDDLSEMERKNSSLQELLQKLKQSRAEIHRQNQELKLLATRDPLTLCLNRRAFFTELNPLYEQSLRTGAPLTCLMIDVDHFKSINDRYGHSTGDQVLFQIAELLRNRSRTTDVVCRYGGEEFAVILPQTDLEGSRIIAERLRMALAETPLAGVSVTASFGVSSLQLGPTGPQGLLDQADQALYSAKRTGRNKVVVFSDVILETGDTIAPSGPATEPIMPAHKESTIPYPAVTALISALAYRDTLTAEHSRRVADYCVAVGRSLLSQSECYLLEVAALLHDIGKLGVPDSILFKPGPLTDEEWKVMRVHDRMGVEIVTAAFGSEGLTRIVGSYQSRYGGSPRDRSAPIGTSIPLAARLLAISDAFDAMTTDRAWRKGLTREQAYAELRQCSGSQFDPKLVEKFITVVSAQSSLRVHEPTPSITKDVALRLGTQIEHLANAIDARDTAVLAVSADEVALEARRCGLTALDEAAEHLKKLVTTGGDWTMVVALAHELLEICRSAQSVYLRSAREDTAASGVMRRPTTNAEPSEPTIPAASSVEDPESIFSEIGTLKSVAVTKPELEGDSRREFERPLVLPQ